MREILFKAKAINRDKGYHRTSYKNGEWVYGLVTQLYDERFKTLPAEMRDIDGIVGIEIDYKTIGQFTGLYDDTRWEDLTDTEKKKFYNSVKSEDGKTIRWESVEDVKRLWKGRPIFEGDIVECFSSDYAGRPKIDTIIVRDMTDYNTMVYLNCSNELKNIGNIHDNPELLKEGVSND